MASEQKVKQYLAYWFQLGKKVLIRNGQEALLPQVVIMGDRYSDEFEAVWQQILSSGEGDCYLEGTHETISELLTPAWELNSCARCSMPIPMRIIGMPPLACPCHDLPSWPNTSVPSPRDPIDSHEHLQGILNRLGKKR